MVLDAYGNPYHDAQVVQQPAGAIMINGRHVADTLQCVHCGGHFAIVKGSGRRRGFCTLCHGVTCGSRGCLACLPTERRLELREAGR